MKIDALRLQAPYQVKLVGKGRKERTCPLWPETVAALQSYLDDRAPELPNVLSVFVNANRKPITRFGIRHIVRKYAGKAAKVCPSIESKKVGPHTVRHTTATHLLQAGNDISVVKDWLGHADINTTHGYVEIDMKMKRKALEACQPPKSKGIRRARPKWMKREYPPVARRTLKAPSIQCVEFNRPTFSKGSTGGDLGVKTEVCKLHITQRFTLNP